MTCVCESPQPYIRPSGRKVCNKCGGDLVPKKAPEVRP